VHELAANTERVKVVTLAERRYVSSGPDARKLQRPSIDVSISGPLTPLFGVMAALSLAFHIAIAFGIKFVLPDPKLTKAPNTTLDVVLVNSKSASAPIKPDLFAQANLDGGGNTDEARRAKTPLPVTPTQNEHTDDETLTHKVQDLEEHARQLMTKMKADKAVDTSVPQGRPSDKRDDAAPADLVEKSLQMARLEAQIARNMEIYQQRPKRQFIGARAKEFRFASYVDQWRQKIERVGTLHFPQEAKIRKLYGYNLQLTVAIRADGSVERIDINRSSQYKVLDDAAKQIVMMAAPFSKFPDEISKDTDIIEITRTWTFTQEDQISAE